MENVRQKGGFSSLWTIQMTKHQLLFEPFQNSTSFFKEAKTLKEFVENYYKHFNPSGKAWRVTRSNLLKSNKWNLLWVKGSRHMFHLVSYSRLRYRRNRAHLDKWRLKPGQQPGTGAETLESWPKTEQKSAQIEWIMPLSAYT